MLELVKRSRCPLAAHDASEANEFSARLGIVWCVEETRGKLLGPLGS
jgi:hypothetical protein